MSEANLWQRLKRGMEARCFLTRIENVVGVGTPDVYWAMRDGTGDGWIELKHCREWPKRASTKVLGGDGMRPEQKSWCYAHRRVKVSVWIGVVVERSFFLVDGIYAREVNDWTKEDFYVKSRMAVDGKIDWETMAKIWVE